MRTKRTILNFLTDVFPQLLIAFLGIYKSKLFLNFLGEEQLGLYQLYAQVVAYLVLIEGGIGSAILFRLYEPLAKKDSKKINTIMSTARYLFRIIGILILIVGVMIAFNVGLLVHSNTIQLGFIQLTFFFYLISQSVLYFTMPERMLFDADQKRYIPNLIFQITTVLKSIIEIVIVLVGGDLLAIVISLLVTSILSNVILVVASKKQYSNLDYHAKKDFTVLKDVKHLFINTIGNLITNNIDILIVTKVIGLGSVVIYTAYNYIVESLRQIIDKLTGATMSSVANLLVNDKEKSYDVFLEFNSFCFYVAGILCVPLLFALNPFIDIWYEGKIATTLSLSFLFSASLYYQIVRTPLKVYTLASGMFEKVKKYVILECIINLSLSLLLVHFLGIAGVLIATLISFIIADYIPKSITIHRELLKKSIHKYQFNNLKYIVITILSVLIFYVINQFEYTSILVWFCYSCVIFILNFMIVTGYFYLNHDLKFIDRFGLKKFLKRSKNV